MKTKWRILFLLFLLSVFLSGCCVGKKSKTTTNIHTTYKVDTILRIHFDKIPLVTQGALGDTLVLQNTTSEARAFYDYKINKIVLQLKGKVFDVPVKINATKDVLVKEKTVDKKIPFTFYIFCFVAGFFFSFFILKYKR